MKVQTVAIHGGLRNKINTNFANEFKTYGFWSGNDHNYKVYDFFMFNKKMDESEIALIKDYGIRSNGTNNYIHESLRSKLD